MRKLIAFLAGATLAVGLCAAPAPSLAYEAICGPLGVLHYQKEKSYGGYVLYTNHTGGTKTYLIDLEGNVVHEWNHGRIGFMAELLPNATCRTMLFCAPTPTDVNFAANIARWKKF